MPSDAALLYNSLSCSYDGFLNCIREFISDGPRNLSIVEYEDYLECSAEGNPTPIFKWIDVVANKSINGSIYTLNLTNDKEHTLYCTAENMYASLSKHYIIKGYQITVCILYFV